MTHQPTSRPTAMMVIVIGIREVALPITSGWGGEDIKDCVSKTHPVTKEAKERLTYLSINLTKANPLLSRVLRSRGM